MNGYGSQRKLIATPLSAIQAMTTSVCPMMYWGVPKKRAACSAPRPKTSGPKVPWCSSRAATQVEARRVAGRRTLSTGSMDIPPDVRALAEDPFAHCPDPPVELGFERVIDD